MLADIESYQFLLFICFSVVLGTAIYIYRYPSASTVGNRNGSGRLLQTRKASHKNTLWIVLIKGKELRQRCYRPR